MFRRGTIELRTLSSKQNAFIGGVRNHSKLHETFIRNYWKRGSNSGMVERSFVSPLKKVLPVMSWDPTQRQERKQPMEIHPDAISMDKIKGIPHIPNNVTNFHNEPVTTITTLDNGINVISENTPGTSSTIGVYIKAGSKNLTQDNIGVTSLLNRMAYKSSSVHSASEIVAHLEEMGLHAFCSASRDAVTYSIDCVRDRLPLGLSVLAETVTKSLYLQEEIEEQKEVLKVEAEEIALFDPVSTLFEKFHETAYGKQGLGLTQYCPPDQVEKIGRKELIDFVESHYIGPRMVVVGAGCDHNELVDLANKEFGNVPKVGTRPVIETVSQYHGGSYVDVISPEEKMERDRRGEKSLGHVIVGFECPSFKDEDSFAVFLLEMLMGGGEAFSSGGPGKGMYSRVYKNVLRRSWVDSAAAFMFMYDDTGLFGLHGTAPHTKIRDLTETLIVEAVEMATHIEDEELERAKKRLCVSSYMNLESRALVFEDMGRSVLSFGERKSPKECVALVEKLTKEDVLRVARNIISSNPSYIVQTEPNTLIPRYDDIVSYFKAVTNSH